MATLKTVVYEARFEGLSELYSLGFQKHLSGLWSVEITPVTLNETDYFSKSAAKRSIVLIYTGNDLFAGKINFTMKLNGVSGFYSFNNVIQTLSKTNKTSRPVRFWKDNFDYVTYIDKSDNLVELSILIVPDNTVAPRAEVTNNASLSHQLISYFSKVPADVTIICTDNRTLNSHKHILSARSEVFETMLNSGLSETSTNEIKMDDFDFEVVQAMLQFICTDKVDETSLRFFVKPIFEIAHKYQIMGLMSLCENFMSENLNLDNILKYLMLSEMYDLFTLKSSCVKYIVKDGKQLLSESVDEFYSKLSLKTIREIMMAAVAK
jgi:hypothetical protein